MTGDEAEFGAVKTSGPFSVTITQSGAAKLGVGSVWMSLALMPGSRGIR